MSDLQQVDVFSGYSGFDSPKKIYEKLLTEKLPLLIGLTNNKETIYKRVSDTDSRGSLTQRSQLVLFFTVVSDCCFSAMSWCISIRCQHYTIQH
jgi:hypothetical protein